VFVKGQSAVVVTIVLSILILIFARAAWVTYKKGPPQAYRPIADEQRRVIGTAQQMCLNLVAALHPSMGVTDDRVREYLRGEVRKIAEMLSYRG
jgi:hypothetical protein